MVTPHERTGRPLQARCSSVPPQLPRLGREFRPARSAFPAAASAATWSASAGLTCNDTTASALDLRRGSNRSRNHHGPHRAGLPGDPRARRRSRRRTPDDWDHVHLAARPKRRRIRPRLQRHRHHVVAVPPPRMARRGPAGREQRPRHQSDWRRAGPTVIDSLVRRGNGARPAVGVIFTTRRSLGCTT